MNIRDFRATVDSLVREVPADALPAAIGEFARGKATLEAKMQDRAIQQAANGSDPKPQADLSTAEIARMYDKSPQTVRRWIGKGFLDAYRFQGREWRVTPEGLRKFIDEQRQPLKPRIVSPELGMWRRAAANRM